MAAIGLVRASRLGAGGAAWIDLSLALGLALLWRIVFFNGEFGSDDAVYMARALDVATGAWTSSDYNGGLRYGFNLPAGLLMRFLGTSVTSANLWSLICSLSEIALVYAFTRRRFGPLAALTAALLLGAAPLHVAVATRIHADPIVSVFLTLAFVAVDLALTHRSLRWCAVCGLALGAVFWSKELAAVVFLAFVPLLVYFRRFGLGVLVALAGLALMLALHGWLMWTISGDPLHAVKVVVGQLGRTFIQAGDGDDSPTYYLRYLFVDIRHIGLSGWLMVAGLWALRHDVAGGKSERGSAPGNSSFMMIWGLGLLVVLSVFPVSMVPLRFTMKQSNYISLFLAPMSILAAVALVSWRPPLQRCGLAVALILSISLSALQQADYRSFTGNSKGVLREMAGRPGALLVGSSNLAAIGTVERKLREGVPDVLSFRDVLEAPSVSAGRMSAAAEVFAVIDPQTARWFAGRQVVDRPLPCWQPVGRIEPQDLGAGNLLADGLMRLASRMPSVVADRAASALGRLARPEPAQVYRVPRGRLWCGVN